MERKRGDSRGGDGGRGRKREGYIWEGMELQKDGVRMSEREEVG